MDATIWFIVEIIGFVLSAVLFIVNIILFIKLKVPLLVSELSGKKIKKEIKQIRANNESSSRRRQTVGRQNSINPLKKIEEEKVDTDNRGDESTTVLSYDSMETMVLSNQTSVLYQSNNTTVLESDKQFEVIRDVLLINTGERIL